MKNSKKISNICKTIFGYGIIAALLVGTAAFICFIIALIAGGNTSILLCNFTHKYLFPLIIYGIPILVILGLITTYFSKKAELTEKVEDNEE